MAKRIDGKALSLELEKEIKEEVRELTIDGKQAALIVILVGENPASATYVAAKERACERVGMYSETLRLPESTSEEDLIKAIEDLNRNPLFDGILVQLPLPAHINEESILKRIDPRKDVDCFHPENVGKLVIGNPIVKPCTPAGILEMLKSLPIELSGKHVVVVGRSNIVGKPIANMLIQPSSEGNCTVTICHSRTDNLTWHTVQADILIVAIGRPNFITEDMVKKDSVVIDVGINRLPTDNEKGYEIVGDVDFKSVSKKVEYISPVPGGVGRMTIAMLLKNTLACCKNLMQN